MEDDDRPRLYGKTISSGFNGSVAGRQNREIDPNTVAAMIFDLVSGGMNCAHLDPTLLGDPDQAIATIPDVLPFDIARPALVAPLPPRRLEAVAS